LLQFILNDKTIATDNPSGMTMLDFIRYHQHLMGTKIGCREGDCGACTVLVGEIVDDKLVYESMTSCLLPIANANGKHIVTIEGINFPDTLNPIQLAMADEGATQCGFCTPGFVVSLAGFCLSNKSENAIAAVDGNICRCTGYKSIERAANRIAAITKEKQGTDSIEFVTKNKILPEYFSEIKERLNKLKSATFTIDHSPFTIVGGGTDLYVQKHEEMVYADSRYVFDHPELNSIIKEGNKCILGSSVTVSDLMASPIFNEAFPLFQQYAKPISSTPIRNMATIAGNFINASPIGDFTIFFLALDAQLILSDGKTKRELPLRKLYKGYKDLDKRKEEHIEQIWFELPDKDSYFNFEKVSKRTHLDIASVNTAIHLRMNGEAIKEASLSAGGVGPVPMFLKKTSGFLIGKKVNDKIIEEIITIMQSEISPISDARGTAAYKTLLLGQLIKSHFINISKESHESHQ